MTPEILHFTEINNVHDDLFLDWLDLFEISFPPNEKLLFSTLVRMLKNKSLGDAERMHMAVIQNEAGRTVGMTLYQLQPEKALAALWYLATHPSERGKGLGARIYQQIVGQLDPALYKALILEVEIPGEPQASVQAERRIQFYKRNGAYLLKGIHYLQDIGWHQPPTPMHIMIHPLRALTPEQAFDLAKVVFEDLLKQTGKLELEG